MIDDWWWNEWYIRHTDMQHMYWLYDYNNDAKWNVIHCPHKIRWALQPHNMERDSHKRKERKKRMHARKMKYCL